MTVSRAPCGRNAVFTHITLPVLALGLGLGGCFDHKVTPIVPCVVQGWVSSVSGPDVDKVDLLFMIDDSGSMGEEQASLAAELPRLVRILATGDRTGDGPSTDDFPPVRSLHVGVVTSDMGVASFNVPTCTRSPQFGDDGLLRTVGATSLPGCRALYPSFLEYVPSSSVQTPEEFGADFRCVAVTGTGGCGFEQQLESPLKAITLAGSSTTFYGGTHGHGDAENAGFMRPDSVLAVVVVTDEEDCSVASGFEGIFDQSAGSAYTGNLNLRCHLYPETQWPVQRYIDGLKALRPGREDLVVFGTISGVPVDLIPASGQPDYDAILADPRMFATIDAAGTGLEPSCNVPGRGLAFPPRRIVEVARGFGGNGIVQSICQESFSGAVDAIVNKIGNALDNVCLPRRLAADASGFVGCDVVEVIPPPGTFEGQPSSCAELGGVEPAPRRTNPDGSLVCAVIQLATTGAAATDEGWRYEDLSAATAGACAGGQRVAFTPGAIPPHGISVMLECLERFTGSGSATSGGPQLGTRCDPASDDPSANPCADAGLLCEPSSHTCQLACDTDADCPSSLMCDRSTSASGVCRNPICVE